MKHLKIYMMSLLTVLLFSSSFISAQEEVPTPVGGISAIAQNLEYPEEAHKNNIEGKVFVKAIVDESGNVVESKVLKGIGHGCDEAAVAAVKSVKFNPAVKDGKKVKAEVTIPLSFKLNKDKS
jgi:TonB family protein